MPHSDDPTMDEIDYTVCDGWYDNGMYFVTVSFKGLYGDLPYTAYHLPPPTLKISYTKSDSC